MRGVVKERVISMTTRHLGPIIAMVVAFVAVLASAGTLTVTHADVGKGMTLYTLDWTGDAVSGHAFAVKRGYLTQAKIVPDSGTTQPTDLYDITLVDEDGVDVLDGNGADQSNSAATLILFDPPIFWDAIQTLDLVVANAGAGKGGLVYLWVQ